MPKVSFFKDSGRCPKILNYTLDGGVLLLVKLQPATLLKATLLYGCFSRFLNYTNGIKSRKASHH